MNTFKLGKKKPRFDKRTLQFARYFTTMPYAPQVSHWPNAAPLGMLMNDSIGDCTIAGALHIERLWSKANNIDYTPTDAEALAAYIAVTASENNGVGYNPQTGENDNGCSLLDVLNYWRQIGIGSRKIGAFVQIDPSNHMHVEHASFFFGGLYIGVNLPECAMNNPQNGWYVPKTGLTGNGAPGSAGGHCVSMAGYSKTELDLVTWGMRIPASWEFWDSYVDEVYAAVSTNFIINPIKCPNGFSMVQLMQDLQLVTS